MLRVIRRLLASKSANRDSEENDLDNIEDDDDNTHRPERWGEGGGGYPHELGVNEEYIFEGPDDTEGGAFWPIQPQRRRRADQGNNNDGDHHFVLNGGEGVDMNNNVHQPAQVYRPHNIVVEDATGVRPVDNGNNFNAAKELEGGAEGVDAFAPQPGDFPEVHQEEDEESLRHRVGVTIIVTSVVANLCTPLFFIAGLLVPIFSFINDDGTKSAVYLVGEAVGNVGVRGLIFSGKLRRINHCLNRYWVAALGLSIGVFFLVLALFAALRAFKWTTGIKRFVRPFLFSGASFGSGIAFVYIVRGYVAACNGSIMWFRPEPGFYCIIFGTVVTLAHTLVLYAQVSRYPLRTLVQIDDSARMPRQVAPVEEDEENHVQQ